MEGRKWRRLGANSPTITTKIKQKLLHHILNFHKSYPDLSFGEDNTLMPSRFGHEMEGSGGGTFVLFEIGKRVLVARNVQTAAKISNKNWWGCWVGWEGGGGENVWTFFAVWNWCTVRLKNETRIYLPNSERMTKDGGGVIYSEVLYSLNITVPVLIALAREIWN